MSKGTSTDLKFKTWEEAAAWTLGLFRVRKFSGSLEPSYYADMVDEISAYDQAYWGGLASHAAAGYFASTNRVVDEDALVALLASKQRDYGHDNILRYGADGVKVRISDKVCRLKNLLGRGIDAANEAIEDSWLDIIGYSVIGSMLEDGTFELPLSDDVEVEADRVAVPAVTFTLPYRLYEPELVYVLNDGKHEYRVFDGEPF